MHTVFTMWHIMCKQGMCYSKMPVLPVWSCKNSACSISKPKVKEDDQTWLWHCVFIFCLFFVFAFIVFVIISSVLSQESSWEEPSPKLPILCGVGRNIFNLVISAIVKSVHLRITFWNVSHNGHQTCFVFSYQALAKFLTACGFEIFRKTFVIFDQYLPVSQIQYNMGT